MNAKVRTQTTVTLHQRVIKRLNSYLDDHPYNISMNNALCIAVDRLVSNPQFTKAGELFPRAVGEKRNRKTLTIDVDALSKLKKFVTKDLFVTSLGEACDIALVRFLDSEGVK